MRSWLLIEHPEAWARDVADRVLARALPRPRLRELAELRRRYGLRPLLVRRPGYRAGRPAGRTVLVGGVGGPGGRWLERLELDRPARAGRPRPGRGRRPAPAASAHR